MSEGFATRSQRSQIYSLRQLVPDLLAQAGLGESTFRLVNLGFNAVFRVFHSSGDYALRIPLNSRRTPEQAAGEVAWIESLADESSIHVPRIKRMLDGSPLAWLRGDPTPGSLFTRDRGCLIMHWHPGRIMGETRSTLAHQRLGNALSVLHRQAEQFRFPQGTSRPVLKDVLDGLPWRLPDDAELIDTVEQGNRVLERLRPKTSYPVHFDLHHLNVMLWGQALVVLDFDDSVIAPPAFDVAQSLFYIRRSESDACERSFWTGIGKTPAELGVTEAEIELLLACRAILLANDLLVNVTADLIAMAPAYVERTQKRVKAFCQTGRFDPSVGK